LYRLVLISACQTLTIVLYAGAAATAAAARRREGAQINTSLMALKDCVRALAAAATTATTATATADTAVSTPSSKEVFIPFRRSSLTTLLKPSFTAPGALTTVIATVSPSR
jgi:Kinesin motor domain